MNAAAKVVTLEEALEKLGDSPLLATARQELEKELQRQRKLAKDTRSTATKLAQKQGWIERESKRLDEETKRLPPGTAACHSAPLPAFCLLGLCAGLCVRLGGVPVRQPVCLFLGR